MHLNALISIPSDWAMGKVEKIAPAKIADAACNNDGLDGSYDVEGGRNVDTSALVCWYAVEFWVIST